ncbi:YeeE/YedE family protein [Sphingomonas oryzagri]
MAWNAAHALAGFEGGLLIGFAGAMMLLALGRIAGVSGLAARALGMPLTGAPRTIAAAFVFGLPAGAAIVTMVRDDIVVRMSGSVSLLVAAGLLVGYGTRLGGGCTSGHGVCGLSRLSPRSILATATFMVAGIATVVTMRLVGVAG